MPALIRDVRRAVMGGGPLAIIWTHAGPVSQALLGFDPAGRNALAPILLDHANAAVPACARFPC
jgi:hypothetical protein